MHADEVDTDPDLVRRLLAAQLPQFADLPIEPFPSTGTVNAIYRLGSVLCVRMPRVAAWARDLRREVRWLPRLAPHLPLAVPEPLARGRPGLGYPYHWAVYRWIEGEPWAADRIADPSAAAADLAGFVASLRRIDTVGAPRSGRSGRLSTRNRPLRSVMEALDGVIDAGAVTAVWEESLTAPAWSEAPVWTHGDLLPPNLLLRDGRLHAVIDFGGVGIGDPACDLIAAWSVCTAETRPLFRAALDPDDATWARARGWALSIALFIIPYYPETNPAFVDMAMHMVDELLDDDR
jgi:aminoglycoside phosphotransferase (APT) family kinase protein